MQQQMKMKTLLDLPDLCLLRILSELSPNVLVTVTPLVCRRLALLSASACRARRDLYLFPSSEDAFELTNPNLSIVYFLGVADRVLRAITNDQQLVNILFIKDVTGDQVEIADRIAEHFPNVTHFGVFSLPQHDDNLRHPPNGSTDYHFCTKTNFTFTAIERCRSECCSLMAFMTQVYPNADLFSTSPVVRGQLLAADHVEHDFYWWPADPLKRPIG